MRGRVITNSLLSTASLGRVNHTFIFELDVVTRLDYAQIWEFASFFTLLFFASAGLYCLSVWAQLSANADLLGPHFPINPGVWHFMMFLVIPIVLFWPFEHFYR
jgi:hypothetical protein